MSRMTRAALCAVLLIPRWAEASNFGDFLPGAKAMGMGMAYSAIADDPWALWFNPAGTANTPYIQAASSLGRIESPTGPLSFMAFSYVRPYEPINTATVGAGYYAGRQRDGGDRDEVLFHYAQEFKIPRLPLTRPLRAGGNFKAVNGPSGFGLGFDVGAQLRSLQGVTAGVGLRDMTTKVGIRRPTVYFSGAYVYDKWLTVATDMRVRPGLTEFYPGVEAAFHQGLLKVRFGRGFQLDGVSRLALGLGVDFSPVVLDAAMGLPSNGIHREGGLYQMSLSYKFGAPSFAGRFVGQAAAEAERLRSEIEKLRQRKKTAEAEAKSADTRREIIEGELRVVDQRVRETQEELRELNKRRDLANYEAEAAAIREQAAKQKPEPPPRVRPLPPPPVYRSPWPKKHEIKHGDTLRTLARQHYGDANLWEVIYEANKDKVERGLPQEGAIFTIPAPHGR